MHSGTDLEKDALAIAKAEVAACLVFLETEMEWEYFRAEMLYFDKEEKSRCSADNARRLKNYLAESGHGIAFLREHRAQKERIAELEAQLAEMRRSAMEEAARIFANDLAAEWKPAEIRFAIRAQIDREKL